MENFFDCFFGKQQWGLGLAFTTTCHSLYPNASMSLMEGDLIHLLYGERCTRQQPETEVCWDYEFDIISFDLQARRFYGPKLLCQGLGCSSVKVEWVRDLITKHAKGIIRTDAFTDSCKSTFLTGLSYGDWRKVMQLLDNVRHYRILQITRRLRKNRQQIFPGDDMLNTFVARAIKRVTAILNYQLYWGGAIDSPIILLLNTKDRKREID